MQFENVARTRFLLWLNRDTPKTLHGQLINNVYNGTEGYTNRQHLFLYAEKSVTHFCGRILD